MPSRLPRDARFRPKPRVLVRQVDAEAVLLDLETARYFSLNATGRRVWELLSAGAPVAATLEALAAEFDAPPAELEADVAALVEELESSGLLLRDGPEGSEGLP